MPRKPSTAVKKDDNITFETTVQEQKEIKAEPKTTTKNTKYKVTAPVENFNGEVAGVHFAYGEALVNKGWILDWFKEKGYKIKEV